MAGVLGGWGRCRTAPMVIVLVVGGQTGCHEVGENKDRGKEQAG